MLGLGVKPFTYTLFNRFTICQNYIMNKKKIFLINLHTILYINLLNEIFLGGMLVVSVSVAGLVTLAAMTQPALAPEAKHSLLQYVTGKYLEPSNCRVHFEWEQPQLVGETMTFIIKVLFNYNNNYYYYHISR